MKRDYPDELINRILSSDEKIYSCFSCKNPALKSNLKFYGRQCICKWCEAEMNGKIPPRGYGGRVVFKFRRN